MHVNKKSFAATTPARSKTSTLAAVPAGKKPKSSTERTLAFAATKPSGTLMRVAITVHAPRMDWSRFRGPSGVTDRARAKAARSAELEPTFDALRTRLVGMGARVDGTLWLGESLNAVVRVETLPAIAALPMVRAINPDAGLVAEAADGEYVRSSLGLSVFYTNSVDASMGGRVPGPVLVGIIEPQETGIVFGDAPNFSGPAPGHVAWLSGPGGYSRIVEWWDCVDYPWCGGGAPAPAITASSHGNRVMGILAGSVELGQDPTYPELPGDPVGVDQIRRSGIATGAFMTVLRTPPGSAGESLISNNVGLAISSAFVAGVDVLNISAGIPFDGFVQPTSSNPGVEGCGYGEFGAYNPAGIDQVITNATDGGMLLVKSAGNRGHDFPNPLTSGYCSLTSPAWHPDVLSVGALGTVGASASATLPYGETTMLTVSNGTGSSQGGLDWVVWGGAGESGGIAYSAVTGVGVSAPGQFDTSLAAATNSYTSAIASGTSYAAPAVAGSAALLRHLHYLNGWGHDARLLLANMLLFGDGFDGTVGSERPRGFNPVSGAGRLRMHFVNPGGISDMTVPWYFALTPEPLFPEMGGPDHCIALGPEVPEGTPDPIPTAINEVKAVALWREDGGVYGNPATDIDLSLFNACPGGALVDPSSWELVAADWGYNSRERLRVVGQAVHGKCLRVCARVYGGAAKATYIAAYAHSDSTELH